MPGARPSPRSTSGNLLGPNRCKTTATTFGSSGTHAEPIGHDLSALCDRDPVRRGERYGADGALGIFSNAAGGAKPRQLSLPARTGGQITAVASPATVIAFTGPK